MVEFLIRRPIAVIMAFLALVVLGCVTFATLPVSLLPDVAIPHVAVRVDGGDMPAREVEATLVAPLRRHLMQVEGLDRMRSRTGDTYATIDLTMEYGVDTDLAFVEVNEKIDAAMNSFPSGTPRPKAVKASATDIPVLYVNITQTGDGGSFADVGDVAENVVRRRLEQLPEVAMADITGVPRDELRIVPDRMRMASAGITDSDIENALRSNNTEPGSMTVRDGYYEYNIRISNTLSTPGDVKGVRFMKNGRMHTLGDFCTVELAEAPPSGYSLYNGDRAVTLAIIKQSSASMADMEDAVDAAIESLGKAYPGLKLRKSRSQTELLDFTISNLKQNLILGLILVFIICALFMRSVRLPFVTGITIVVAVIITFLLFYLFRVSINIVSLAGLILAVGMMIDNSVIVAENITQYRERGHTLDESCVAGTTEMITPMLSSSLTTVAVFVPLVFMSGIAGAIFSDQAFAITAGLASSYVTGITLLPVLYRLFFRKVEAPHRDKEETALRQPPLIRWYDGGIDFIFRHKAGSVAFVVLSVAAVWPLLRVLDTERMPHIDTSEAIMKIDWNENLTIGENMRRTRELAEGAAALAVEHSAYVGIPDYMLDNVEGTSATTAEIYLRASSTEGVEALRDTLASRVATIYPACDFGFAPPGNVFEKIFSTDEPPLEARLFTRSGGAGPDAEMVGHTVERIAGATGLLLPPPALREQINISVDREAATLYGADYAEVMRVLKSAFRGNEAGTLKSSGDYVAVRVADRDRSVAEVLSSAMVRTAADASGAVHEIPLKHLVTTTRGADFKTLTASGSGVYHPVRLDVEAGDAGEVQEKVTSVVTADGEFDVEFTGSLFSNREMMRELTVILVVSLLMMYFILCAQFESFMQPLIVLVEIPVDVSFALLTLWVCGQTLNLMSAIGIIVTSGIVVNDSILKLDAINELRRKGMPLIEAIHLAGQRRLKPIIMTSLTTIMAMLPVLFTSDMGSELQRPLAWALIGSMTVGTLVSIFIIPLVYYLIYRHRK